MSAGWRGWLHDLARALPRFHRHNGLHLSAGVAFYTLLSLAPLLYLAAALAGRILRDEDDVTARLLDGLRSLLPPSFGASLDEVTRSLHIDDPLVWIAVPALAWIASSVVTSLEWAVNVAFERTRRRNVLSTRLKSFALLGAGLLGLLASVVAATALPAAERLLWEAHLLPEGMPLAGPLSRLLILAVPFALFATFYKVLPGGRVSWRSAMGGALLALLLWEGTRRGFGRVLAHSPGLGLLSGTLSGVVTVLLWTYAAVVTLLLGAEFAALRHERLESSESRAKNGD